MKKLKTLMCLMVLLMMAGMAAATDSQSSSSSSSSSTVASLASSSSSSSSTAASSVASSIATSTLPAVYNCHAMGSTVLYGILIGSIVCIVIAAVAVIKMGGNVMDVGIAAAILTIAAFVVSVIYNIC